MQPENISFYLPKILRCGMVHSLLYRYLVWSYGKADIALCPSAFAERLLKIRNGRIKTRVISNGIDLTRFSGATPDLFRAKSGTSDGRVHILSVGRIDPEKRIDTLIRAMPLVVKRHKNAHLNIIGSGILLDQMKALVAEEKLGDAVTFHGRVPEEELVSAFMAADLFVLPSLAELEGIAVLEAMASGLPIVIANSPQSASVNLVDGNGFLFEPSNPADLALKVDKLIADKALRERMGKRSLHNVREYDISRAIDILEETYYELRDGGIHASRPK